MARQATRAVLLDALGTLVDFEPPGPRLRAALEAHGVEVPEEQAWRAIGAEIAYFRAHLQEGGDRASLAALRRRCAGVMAAELPDAARALGTDALVVCLEESFAFLPYPDAIPALEDLGRRGLRLVVVSNWDCSLHDVLADTGLRELLDGVVSSAEVGAAKPDPEPFRHALELAGVAAGEAWHVGDSVVADVQGARAAGVEPVFVDRGAEAPPPGVRTVSALTELGALLAAA